MALREPALQRFLPNYPDIKVEIVIDYGLTDIVAERCDAGAGLRKRSCGAVPCANAVSRRRCSSITSSTMKATSTASGLARRKALASAAMRRCMGAAEANVIG